MTVERGHVCMGMPQQALARFDQYDQTPKSRCKRMPQIGATPIEKEYSFEAPR